MPGDVVASPRGTRYDARSRAHPGRRAAPAWPRAQAGYRLRDERRRAHLVRERLHARHPEWDEPHLRAALIEELYGVRVGVITSRV